MEEENFGALGGDASNGEAGPFEVFGFVVSPVPSATDDLVEFGERYWALSGIDETVTPARALWATKSSDLAQAEGFPNGRSYVFAAAGVRALMEGFSCPTCDKPLSLRSRQNFEKLLAGRDPERCVECDSELLKAIDRESSQSAQHGRRTAKDKGIRRAALDSARKKWAEAQRAYIADHYALKFNATPGPFDYMPNVRTGVAALSAIRHAPGVTPIPPADTWSVPLAPTTKMSSSILADCYHAGVIAIHPASPINAFVWSSTFEEALAAAGDSLADLPQPKWDQFYPTRAHWYVPSGSSMGTAAAWMDEELVDRMSPSELGRVASVEMLDLVVELIAEETIRYFEFQLDDHNLPKVPDNHISRLREAAMRLALVRPLSETYNLAWTMVRAAAATAQAKQFAPKPHMTTHAVNLFESKVQEVLADPSLYVKPFHEDGRVPLSAMTRTLFITLLDSGTMSTSRGDVEAILADAAGSHVDHEEIESADDYDFVSAMRVVFQTGAESDPHAVYSVLIREGMNARPAVASAANSLAEVVEDLRIVSRGLHVALAGAVAACRVLTHRADLPDVWSGGEGYVRRSIGAYLAELMRQAAQSQSG